MKPSIKQIESLRDKLSAATVARALSYADIARLSGVDQAQVHRICNGQFKTFSNNVVQVCRALEIRIPDVFVDEGMDPDWMRAHASLRRIWEQAPDGAAIVTRVLDAIADLQRAARPEAADDAARTGGSSA